MLRVIFKTPIILCLLCLSLSTFAQDIPPHMNQRPWVLGGYIINPNNNIAYKYYLTIYKGIIYAINSQKDFPIDNDGRLVFQDPFTNQQIVDDNPLVLDESDFGGKIVIFPGLINMHGHMKYDVLPMWGLAKGQFGNRHQWRKWSRYKNAVSFNMRALRKPSPSAGNYSSDIAKINTCAAVRWSELTALTSGTTAMQGIANDKQCGRYWGAKNVELEEDWYDQRNVFATTDLVLPEFYEPVTTQYILPLIRQGIGTYWDAVQGLINMFNISEQLESSGEDPEDAWSDLPEGVETNKASRYAGWYEVKTRQSKWATLNEQIPSGLARTQIVHLSEGSRTDGYNRIEYPWARFLGLAKRGLTIIHGVGMDANDFSHAAANGVNLVWSPMSNLLLYGETLDVVTALQAGVNVSLGTDWSPTGTKHMLDELKIARRYLNAFEPQGAAVTDEMLVKMATENAAKALGLYDNNGDVTVGKIGLGKLADLMAIKVDDTSNSGGALYSALVNATQQDVALTVVGGNPVYGETRAMNEVGNKWDGNRNSIERLPLAARQDHRGAFNTCGEMAGAKAFRFPVKNTDIDQISGGALSSVQGIDNVLVNAFGTYAQNAPGGGASSSELEALPDGIDPMYNCEDADYQRRMYQYIPDEVFANKQAFGASEWKIQPLSNLPADYNFERDRQTMLSVAE